MPYKVLRVFTDLQDKGFRYSAGMIYPRDGYVPSEKRIKELSSAANKLGQPVIELIADEIGGSEPEKKTKRRKPKE